MALTQGSPTHSSPPPPAVYDPRETRDPRNVCMNYLLTHRATNNGVVGVSIIASPLRNVMGGICEKRL